MTATGELEPSARVGRKWQHLSERPFLSLVTRSRKRKTTSMAKVPADFELRFARASKRMNERMRHLDDIVSAFKDRFALSSPLDHVEILPGRDQQFGVVVFFRTDADVSACEASGMCQSMRDFVFEKLEEFGKGGRDDLDVQFEFDSWENVQNNFQGSYFLRMR